MTITTFAGRVAATSVALMLTAGVANAAGLFDRDRGSMKDAPVEKADRPSCSANVALTTDYVFRGESQSDEGAAIQGGFDCDYRMFYAGVWASSIEFDAPYDGASVEVDVYGGIKHKFSNIELDLGVIYYAYPDAEEGANNDLDYLEIKFGATAELTSNISVSGTVYYSDDYFAESGEAWVVEGGISVGLGTYGRFSPTLSALVGNVDWDDNDLSGIEDFTYWNVGVEVGLTDKFTLDLRYWGTDADEDDEPLKDDRFVATISSSW